MSLVTTTTWPRASEQRDVGSDANARRDERVYAGDGNPQGTSICAWDSAAAGRTVPRCFGGALFGGPSSDPNRTLGAPDLYPRWGHLATWPRDRISSRYLSPLAGGPCSNVALAALASIQVQALTDRRAQPSGKLAHAWAMRACTLAGPCRTALTYRCGPSGPSVRNAHSTYIDAHM